MVLFKRKLTLIFLVLALFTAPQCSKEEPIQETSDTYMAADADHVEAQLKKLAPFLLEFDESILSPGEKALMKRIPRIGRLIDEIFLEQSRAGNVEIFDTLRKQLTCNPTAANQKLMEYFWINKGPYDYESNEPGLKGPGGRLFPPMDPARNFYPNGFTVKKFDAWVKKLAPDASAAARSDFTVIRSTPDGGLKAMPYAEAYARRLKPLAEELRRAAGDIPGQSLARFLEARANAFDRTNDYEESEGLWIALNGKDDTSGGNIDITIGPYENYADELMKRKAAFQLYVGVLRPSKTEALKFYAKHIHKMDDRLWELYRTFVKEQREVAPGKRLQAGEVQRWSKPGAKLTLVAVDLAYSAGYGNAGVQTLAFNLPNVAAWQEKYGSKKVMLMNLLDGKFINILKPIARVVMDADDLANVDQDLFTDNTVRHEISHGIGPSGITVNGKKTTVRERHQKYYSPFEEAKAETVSLLFGFHLARQGLIKDRDFVRKMATTYTASTFRTVRFGVNSDHARGKVFEFNRLVQNGGIVIKNGRIAVDHDRFPLAVEKVVMEVLDVQMRGTSETARRLLEEVGTPTEDLTRGLDAIEKQDIPMDLRVRYGFGDNFGVITE